MEKILSFCMGIDHIFTLVLYPVFGQIQKSVFFPRYLARILVNGCLQNSVSGFTGCPVIKRVDKKKDSSVSFKLYGKKIKINGGVKEILSVQEVVTILYSKLLHKLGHYFLDIQYQKNGIIFIGAP